MIAVKLCSIAVSLLLLTIVATEAAPKGSLVTNLPGFNGRLPSNHYAGYISIDGVAAAGGKKNLFYYFVVSEKKPSKDPVVLWLNGGPGCSSFDGFVYEHGPFVFHSGKLGTTLSLNPYSWSKVSNIIYLDSPCGVGLSYSDNPKNYNTGDLQTASDTHAFLLKWFELYPEFLSNPFYLSGESYAGVYVPSLASEVVTGIKHGKQPRINFKGYLVGNGVADGIFDTNGIVPFVIGMGLISSDIYEDTVKTCKGNYFETSKSCDKNLEKIVKALEGLNKYNILESCYHYRTSSSSAATRRSRNDSSSMVGDDVLEYSSRNNKHYNHHDLSGVFSREALFPSLISGSSSSSSRVTAAASNQQPTFHVPCINDDVATAWLNDESVRKAIHAAPASEKAGPWVICQGRINYSSDIDSMIPYHKNLTAMGYRALIYSGDHDLVVPFTGTQSWVRSINYNITDPWRSWQSNHQVAGYLQAYDKNLTFLTIKGSGHMVPQYKPRESLHFYSRWLEGIPI